MYDGKMWWVASLSKIAIHLVMAPAAANLAAGKAEITINKAARMVAGQAEIADATLAMVDEQRVTTLLTGGVSLVWERMRAPLMRMDAHMLANPEGIRMGGDVVIALGVGAASERSAYRLGGNLSRGLYDEGC